MSTRPARRFSKMHGAGNDFVLIDLRGGQPAPTIDRVRAMADRHTGIGFDQLLTVEDSPRPDCVARYRIWNGDGSPARQCGNGARCVAAWLHREGVTAGTRLHDAQPQGARFQLDSPAGLIAVERLDSGHYALSMGRPDFEPARIPFHADTPAAAYTRTTSAGSVRFGAVSMGNPHALIEVDDVRAAPVAQLAPAVQAEAGFPDGVNVGFAEVCAPDHIRLRVYERGAGETLACGSGACAAVAVLVRQGRVGRQVSVDLPGGRLQIDWPDDDAPIRMAGPATFVFEGEFPA